MNSVDKSRLAKFREICCKKKKLNDYRKVCCPTEWEIYDTTEEFKEPEEEPNVDDTTDDTEPEPIDGDNKKGKKCNWNDPISYCYNQTPPPPCAFDDPPCPKPWPDPKHCDAGDQSECCDFDDPKSYCYNQTPPELCAYDEPPCPSGIYSDPRTEGIDPNPKPIPTSYTSDKPPKLTDEFPYTTPPGPTATFLPTPNPPPDVPIPPNIDPDPPDIVPPPDTPIPPPPPPPTTQCPSMHPDYTSVPGGKSQAQQVRDITAYVNSKNFRHDPDGIPWIPRSSWIPWDGVTTINPCTSTTQQIKNFVFPPPGGIHTMRGLREVFYQTNPFADNANPTVAEIEDWNIEVIRHFRRLLGFNQTTHPVYNNKCMYLEAAWSEERARSNHWTASYPGTLNSAAGPCTIPFSSNAHCGASFIPSITDQQPYLCPPTMATCTGAGGAEGIQNINTDIPWAIKISRIIGVFLNSDGIGAHTGPFIGRPNFGSAWYVNGGNTLFRGKWSGPLKATCP